MTPKQFIASIESTLATVLQIVKAKNQDYAGTSDPWKNLRAAELVGVAPERAILVRMSDKLSRISTLLDKPAAVQGETLEDTIHDLIGYAAILKAYRKQ